MSTKKRRLTVDVRAKRAGARLAKLVRTINTLRSKQGCPWDREQTHASLRPHLIEESYEAVEAIDRGDDEALASEMGDVLFQCVFHAQIAAEDGRFDLADSIEAITAKLIRRHPHVFTPAGRPLSAGRRRGNTIRTSQAVKEQWEQIKAREQGNAGQKRRILAGVPASLPSLLRAYEIGRRVAAVGFEWQHPSDVVNKIEEEVRELREALDESPARAAEELGDLLFAVANLARKIGLEPESALREANAKFTRRFEAVEEHFEQRGRSVHDATLEEMEGVWQKNKLRQKALRPRSGQARSKRS
jgi:MazG family protein